MKKTSLILFLVAGLCALSFGVVNDKSNYKNLKVLPKNISKDQLDSVMHHFTAALNVKCNYCHVRTPDNTKFDFAADDNKHKEIARDMMRMTKKLNKKYFNIKENQGLNTPLKVSCFTCHNGSTDPLTIPVKKAPAKAPEKKDDHSGHNH